MTRSELNLSTGELDTLRRLEDAQRQLHEISEGLLLRREGKKQEDRHAIGRRLNAVAASLKTVTIFLGGEDS